MRLLIFSLMIFGTLTFSYHNITFADDAKLQQQEASKTVVLTEAAIQLKETKSELLFISIP
ncbi:hypothetical protein N9R79_09305 [Vibrio sp.]|nr:hypothetical protein [Vibrio sp.]